MSAGLPALLARIAIGPTLDLRHVTRWVEELGLGAEWVLAQATQL